MQDKMIRFLNSIGIKDTSKYDMKFVSIYKDKGSLSRNKFRYFILKDTLWEFNQLNEFISFLNNINNYDYEFIFSYKEKINLKYISEFLSCFIYSKTFDDYDTYLHLNSKLIIYFNNDVDLESFELIKGEFIKLLSFVCYNLPIETKIYDEKEIFELKNKKEKESNLSSLNYVKDDNKDINEENVFISDNLVDIQNNEEDSFFLSSTSSFKMESNPLLVEELKKKKEEEFMMLNKKTIENIKKEEKEEEERRVERDYKREVFKKSSSYKVMKLEDIDENSGSVDFKGKVFESEVRDLRDNKKMVKLGITNLKSAVYVNLYPSEKELSETKFNDIVGKNIEIKGKVTLFKNAKEFTITGHYFYILPDDPLRDDLEKEKRVELHLHTKMSEMDGISEIGDYCRLASHMGMKAIAVTDHGVVQAFPDAQKAAKKYNLKMLYGSELYLIPDFLNACLNPKNEKLKNCSFVCFDLETTGLSTRYDSITEFGAVKIEGGMVVDSFDILINPQKEIPEKVVEKTHITNEMVKDKPTIKEAFPQILKFIGNSVLVSHNANFDYEHLNRAFYETYGVKFIHPVIDTLALSRYIFPMNRGHSLKALSNRLEVDYDDLSAHRADYDAQVLASCWIALKSMIDIKINEPTLLDLSALNYPKELYKNTRSANHATVLCKNREGLKDLYKIISISECNYVGNIPFVPRSLLNKYRKNLLVGSACFNGEVFYNSAYRDEETLKKSISYYDYIEIQPIDNYSFLINTEQINSYDTLKKYLKSIIFEAENQNKIIVATGDCHYLNPEDKIYRDVMITASGVGDVKHPLNPYNRSDFPKFENPNQHFMSTKEMLDAFSWLEDENKIKEYVVTNTNKIANSCEEIIPIEDKLYPPKIDNCENLLTELCYKKAHDEYGEVLPAYIENRLKQELDGIIGNGYSVTYYIAHELVRMTNEDGYIVGSRGSVGSSFAAYCGGITEVNPLPPHYRCPKCKHVEFHDMKDGITSGYDLEDKNCPVCGTKMIKDGQNIPFETFLGFHAEKVPDIDLNFPADYQATAHKFTKVLLGEDKVFRAGTISSVQFKTAYGYVRNYFELEGLDPNKIKGSYIAALAYGCVGTKRTTGQHPGGIVVVPKDKEIYDFTPIQYPANDTTVEWKTTHFEFSAIHDTILKLDMLGHVDPQALKMMSQLANVNIKDIPMDDKKVISLFTSNDALNLKHKYIKKDVGTTGIPEFGTNFVKQLLREARPTSFKQLLIVSGLSHGTDVWSNNAQTLISKGITDINGVIGCRDDIMSYLISMGLENGKAFAIMETVRKGKKLSDEQILDMENHNVPSYYIDSCKKIKYLFPKGHACAYVMMALRVGYFKIYYPLAFYATFFTLRCDQYDIDVMIKGIDAIHERIEEYEARKSSKDPLKKLSNKEEGILDTLIAALEFVERGFKFEKIDINRSLANEFLIDKENNSLIPPFKVLDGIGENGGEGVINARKEREFDSISDFTKRAKLPSKVIDVLKEMGSLSSLRENEELSLFTDF